MSQLTLSTASAGERAGAPSGFFRTLPWIFVSLGVLAPLVLVATAALGSDVSAIRAQMIVQGSELLAVALLSTAVLGLLYALGEREAAFVTASSPHALREASAT
jgi:Ni/Fe-hydrogenase subunit HybB-like protein